MKQIFFITLHLNLFLYSENDNHQEQSIDIELRPHPNQLGTKTEQLIRYTHTYNFLLTYKSIYWLIGKSTQHHMPPCIIYLNIFQFEFRWKNLANQQHMDKHLQLSIMLILILNSRCSSKTKLTTHLWLVF